MYVGFDRPATETLKYGWVGKNTLVGHFLQSWLIGDFKREITIGEQVNIPEPGSIFLQRLRRIEQFVAVLGSRQSIGRFMRERRIDRDITSRQLLPLSLGVR